MFYYTFLSKSFLIDSLSSYGKDADSTDVIDFILQDSSPVYVFSDISSEDFSHFLRSNDVFEGFYDLIIGYEHLEGFRKKIVDAAILNSLPPNSIFMLDESYEDVNLFKKSGFQLVQLNNTIDFKSLYLKRRTAFSVSHLPSSRFSSWEDLKEFQHPASLLMIFDPYLFMDKRGFLNIAGAILNWIDLFTFSGYLEEQEIYLVTKIDKTDNPVVKYNGESERSKVITKMHDYILDELRRKGGQETSFRLCIIDYNLMFNRVIREHDRMLYTNYFTVSSGRGFKLFQENGKVESRFNLYFHFNLDRANEDLITPSLMNLFLYVDKLIEQIEAKGESINSYFSESLGPRYLRLRDSLRGRQDEISRS